jgi:hypothetical protein
MLIPPSAISNAIPALSSKTAANDKASPLNASPSSISSDATKVTLQSGNATEPLAYSVPKKILTFASSAGDKLSEIMRGNIWANSSASSISNLFKGLGESLLGRFTETQSSYMQTVSESWSSSVAENISVEGIDLATRASATDNTVSLTLTTASKKQIEVFIAFDNENQAISNCLSVLVKTSDELSQEECKAVASLAKGFESALQSIGRNFTTDRPSSLATVDVAGLLDFDPKVLSSVDLKVDASSRFVGLQALTLHADVNRRSLMMNGIDGVLSVDVDLSAAKILGTPEQQKASIDRYLTQFDAANTRAQGKEQLIGQFKSAFAQLQSNYPAADKTTAIHNSSELIFNTARDQWLSGLADFKASMGGEFSSGAADNGKTTGKIDYQVAQQSTIIRRGNKLAASQEETSSLDATIIKCRDGGPYWKTGNYDIYRINDSSTAKTDFTIATAQNGISYVESATRSQIIKQMLDFKKMANHVVVKQFKVPTESATQDDLLASKQQSMFKTEA